MTAPITCIILAAGKGTRMKSATHKVLHEVAGRALLGHVLDATAPLEPAQTIVVVGAQKDQLDAFLAAQSNVSTALQAEQKGTGHAVMCAKPVLKQSDGTALVLYGDVPFVPTQIMSSLCAKSMETNAPVILGFETDRPGAYGRLVLSDNGLEKIVEAKDATEAELAIDCCNSGILAAPLDQLFRLLDAVGNDNASGEYYLTDIVALARAQALPVSAIFAAEADVMGVNSRSDLSQAEAAFQRNRRIALMDSGVTLLDPDSVYLRADTHIEPDVTIEQNVVFGPEVTIRSGAHIRAFSHLEGCSVEAGAVIGPYARLRPGAQVGTGAKVGNFVEVKNAVLGDGAKANHLSYIGDANVGRGANIGAGTITCNYDGYFKYKTDIGENAFIGSNSALIAPVTIGSGAIVGAGSAISQSVNDGELAFTRAQQTSKPGWASRFKAIMSEKKASAKK